MSEQHIANQQKTIDELRKTIWELETLIYNREQELLRISKEYTWTKEDSQ